MIIFITAPPQTPFWGQNIKTLYSYKRKLEDIRSKFHNNPFSRFYVNREQLFAEPTETFIQTDRHTDGNFVEGVFVCLKRVQPKFGVIGPMYLQNLNFIYIYLDLFKNCLKLR